MTRCKPSEITAKMNVENLHCTNCRLAKKKRKTYKEEIRRAMGYNVWQHENMRKKMKMAYQPNYFGCRTQCLFSLCLIKFTILVRRLHSSGAHLWDAPPLENKTTSIAKPKRKRRLCTAIINKCACLFFLSFFFSLIISFSALETWHCGISFINVFALSL